MTQIPTMTLDDAAACLEALGNPLRLSIYRLLVRTGLDGLPVGTIQERVGMVASTLSHHLKVLETVELIVKERRGTTLICKARFDRMNAVVGFLSDECCRDMENPPIGT